MDLDDDEVDALVAALVRQLRARLPALVRRAIKDAALNRDQKNATTERYAPWLAGGIAPSDADRVSIQTLFNSWCAWAMAHDQPCGSKAEMTRALRDRYGFEYYRDRTTRGFRWITLV